MDLLRLRSKMMTTKTCKKGTSRRRSYTRKNGVRVTSACVSHTAKVNRRSSIRCPSGLVARTSYVRRLTSRVKQAGYLRRTPSGRMITVHPKKKSIAVPAGCVPAHGHVVQAQARPQPQPQVRPQPQPQVQIGPLKKGELRKYGYSYKNPEKIRRIALAKAISVDGRSTVYHRLNAVAKLAVSRAPEASKIFAADRNWVRLQKH